MAAPCHCPDLLLSALPDLILGLTEAVKSTAGKYLSSKGFQQGLGDVPWDSPVVKRCLVTAKRAARSLTTLSSEAAKCWGQIMMLSISAFPEQVVKIHSITPSTEASTAVGYKTA